MPLPIKIEDITDEYAGPIITIRPAKECTVSGPLKKIERRARTTMGVKIRGIKQEFSIPIGTTVYLTWPEHPWKEHGMTKPQWDFLQERKKNKVQYPSEQYDGPPGFNY